MFRRRSFVKTPPTFSPTAAALAATLFCGGFLYGGGEAAAQTGASGAGVTLSDIAAIWRAIEDSERPEAFEAFAAAFPDSPAAPTALALAANLRASQSLRATQSTSPSQSASSSRASTAASPAPRAEREIDAPVATDPVAPVAVDRTADSAPGRAPSLKAASSASGGDWSGPAASQSVVGDASAAMSAAPPTVDAAAAAPEVDWTGIADEAAAGVEASSAPTPSVDLAIDAPFAKEEGFSLEVDRAVDSSPFLLSPRELALETQAALNRIGFRAGPEDGIWGARSRAAMRRFQERAGRPVTGEPSVEALTTLRAAPSAEEVKAALLTRRAAALETARKMRGLICEGFGRVVTQLTPQIEKTDATALRETIDRRIASAEDPDQRYKFYSTGVLLSILMIDGCQMERDERSGEDWFRRLLPQFSDVFAAMASPRKDANRFVLGCFIQSKRLTDKSPDAYSAKEIRDMEVCDRPVVWEAFERL